MPFIHQHPAPGFGELTPGWFVVPNNPFQRPAPLGVSTGVGSLIQAHWKLPQNPLVNALSTVGLPPGQKSGNGVLQGLGAIDLEEQFRRWKNPGTWTLGQWLTVIGIGAVVILMTRKNRTAYRAAKLRAKAEYLDALAAAKGKHPTVASRAVKLVPIQYAAPQG